jgi:antitoxin Phd
MRPVEPRELVSAYAEVVQRTRHCMPKAKRGADDGALGLSSLARWRRPPVTRWKLEDARNQFSRVVQAARDEGPQVVTRRGEEAVVVLSFKQFRKLAERKRGLLEFMRGSPLADALTTGALDVERAPALPRELDL